MKLAIDRLSKSDYQKVLKNYRKTTKGIAQMHRLLRLLIIGFIASGFSIYFFVRNYINTAKWYEYLMPSLLIIFGIIFIIASFYLKKQSLNNFYLKNKRSALE